MPGKAKRTSPAKKMTTANLRSKSGKSQKSATYKTYKKKAKKLKAK